MVQKEIIDTDTIPPDLQKWYTLGEQLVQEPDTDLPMIQSLLDRLDFDEKDGSPEQIAHRARNLYLQLISQS